MNFRGRNILIHGLGISNVAVVEYLADKKCASITITDLKTESELAVNIAKIKSCCPEAEFILGNHNETDFLNSDLIIRNPSIPINTPLLQEALNSGIQVETDISLFFKLSPTENIIGVTGTKGKTTTATFIARVLLDQGKRTKIAGNMGIPVMGILNDLKKSDLVVLELSSFMVESLDRHGISPHISVYTNLFPDHLNKYSSFDIYRNSKKGLFKQQSETDICLLSSSRTLNAYLPEIPSKIYRYSASDIDSSVKLKLLGEHYKTDLAAAFILVEILNLDYAKLIKTAESFSGVPHRMENLGEVNGITFINNTAATTPIAFILDISSIISQGKDVYILAGGADKNLDYSEMSELINSTENIRMVTLFKGSATEKILSQINQEKVLGVFDDMKKAFQEIIEKVHKGSIVTLTPGCASFGVFKDEFDRGEQFIKEVNDFKRKK